jgi:ABC-2 type transport system ATP-binding protein
VKGQPIIEAEGLTKTYGSQTAVNNLTLQIQEGEVFGFLGPNGAGKTTTILMFLGLTEPTSGKVQVCGFDPKRESLRVKERVGYLPENVGFYDDMDARQNLQYIARLNKIPDRDSAQKIDVWLKEVAYWKRLRRRWGPTPKG